MNEFMLQLGKWLADWQQTAIANTRYSVVLIFTAMLFTVSILFLWQRKSRSSYIRQLEQFELLREQADHEIAGLIGSQRENAERLVELEQGLVTAKQQLLLSQEKGASLRQEVLLQQQALADKQAEIEQFIVNQHDQNGIIEQLRGDLEKQKAVNAAVSPSLQAQLTEAGQQRQRDQEQIKEKEQQAVLLIEELELLKNQLQQLEQELSQKNEQILRLETHELEPDKQNQTRPIGQGGLALRSHSEKLLQHDKQQLERLSCRIAELENCLNRNNEQLTRQNQQLQIALQKGESAGGDQNESPGMVNRLLSLVPAANRIDIANNFRAEETVQAKNQSLWRYQQELIARLLEQATASRSSNNAGQSAGQVKKEQSASLAKLQQIIDEQSNYIHRLEYDLEIKKVLLRDAKHTVQAIPAAIIAKQQVDQARIEQLEKRLAGRKKGNFSGHGEENLENLQNKVKNFYHKWLS